MSSISPNYLVSTHLPAMASTLVGERFKSAVEASALSELVPSTLLLSDAVFPDVETAEIALRASVAPGFAIAVRIGNERTVFEHPQNIESHKALTRLETARSALAAYAGTLKEKAIRRYSAEGVSPLKRCPGCSSRINMPLLLTRTPGVQCGTECPVCATELVCTERDTKKLALLTEAFEQRQAQVDEARNSHYSKLTRAGHALPAWLIIENRHAPEWLASALSATV